MAKDLDDIGSEDTPELRSGRVYPRDVGQSAIRQRADRRANPEYYDETKRRRGDVQLLPEKAAVKKAPIRKVRRAARRTAR